MEIPNADLARYLIISNKGGNAGDGDAIRNIEINVERLDFVYPMYRLRDSYVKQVSMAKELYFLTCCRRLVEVDINYNNGTAIIPQNADIPRCIILFFMDDNVGDQPNLAAGDCN